MGWFVDNIFSFFGKAYKRADTYKNANDEGLVERFTQTLATEFDDLKYNKVDVLLDSIYNPYTVDESLLEYLEYNLGITLYLGENNRRKVIANITKYYQIKCTSKCYDVLFQVLGMTAVIDVIGSLAITNYDSGGSFDSGLKFDNTASAFNLTCLECMEYNVDVLGTATLTDNLTRAIYSIIKFNEPINYKLKVVTYNGVVIGSPNTYLATSTGGRLKYSDIGFAISFKG